MVTRNSLGFCKPPDQLKDFHHASLAYGFDFSCFDGVGNILVGRTKHATIVATGAVTLLDGQTGANIKTRLKGAQTFDDIVDANGGQRLSIAFVPALRINN